MITSKKVIFLLKWLRIRNVQIWFNSESNRSWPKYLVTIIHSMRVTNRFAIINLELFQWSNKKVYRDSKNWELVDRQMDWEIDREIERYDIKIYFQEKSNRPCSALNFARVEKGEIIPDNTASKSYLPFVKNYYGPLSTYPRTKL